MKAWMRANPAISAILAVAAFILLLIAANSVLGRASCAWYGYQTERSVRYAAFVGCMVKAHDAWVPRTEIRTAQ
ncbi:hypothetical protein D3C81_313880 [compost metagenome]